MRSAAAMAAVTVLFAATLLGGLSYTGELDAALLRGPGDPGGEARAGWKTRRLETAGFSIQLPPDWELKQATRVVVFEAREGEAVLATLSVSQAPRRAARARSGRTKRFVRGGRLLTFRTTRRRTVSWSRVFELAAQTFKPA